MLRNTVTVRGTRNRNKRPPSIQSVSYHSIAGRLASEMMGFLRSSEPRESCPPFRLVIIGYHGVVVFECEVGKDGEVRNRGSAQRLRHSHFPATALLTDRSLLTRTFLIERAPHANSN